MKDHRSPVRRLMVGAAVAAVALLGSGLTAVVGAPSAAAATTAGCGQAPTLASGTRTITSSGQSRSYILRIPDGYVNTRAYKLIFGLHWLNGSATNVDNDNYYGVRPLANNSAIFVAPQGLNAGWANTNGQDVTLIDDIRTQIENALCVDTTQRFAMGFSYGASMSFALACARPTIFRAVAVFSGAQLSGCSGGTQPVAYLGIHGTTDSVLNISNGRSLRDKFVGLNGCTPQNPAEPASGQAQIKTQYSGCRAGYPVTWIAFSGDHYTPSFVGSEAWSFFSALPSTTTTSTTTSTTSTTTRTTTTTASTTTTSTGTRTTTTSGGTGGCAAAYTVASSWTGGFVANVTVTAGSAGTRSWRVTLTLPSGSAVSNGWNATFTGSTGTVTATNASYNGTLGSGQSTSFGFQGTRSGNGVTASCTAG